MHRLEGDSTLCYNVLDTGIYRNRTNTTWLQHKGLHLNSHCAGDGAGQREQDGCGIRNWRVVRIWSSYLVSLSVSLSHTLTDVSPPISECVCLFLFMSVTLPAFVSAPHATRSYPCFCLHVSIIFPVLSRFIYPFTHESQFGLNIFYPFKKWLAKQTADVKLWLIWSEFHMGD